MNVVKNILAAIGLLSLILVFAFHWFPFSEYVASTIVKVSRGDYAFRNNWSDLEAQAYAQGVYAGYLRERTNLSYDPQYLNCIKNK